MNKKGIEKAIEALRDFNRCVKVKADGAYETTDFINAKETAISALEQQLNGGWVPVAERLPENGGWYLVTTEERKVDLAHWFFNEGWKRGHNSNSKVIAWQPIPGPYKEDKDAERN